MKKLKGVATVINIKPAAIIVEGDVVVLNSGGPKMTVESIKQNFVKCVWHDGIEYQSSDFHKDCLTKQG